MHHNSNTVATVGSVFSEEENNVNLIELVRQNIQLKAVDW